MHARRHFRSPHKQSAFPSVFCQCPDKCRRRHLHMGNASRQEHVRLIGLRSSVPDVIDQGPSDAWRNRERVWLPRLALGEFDLVSVPVEAVEPEPVDVRCTKSQFGNHDKCRVITFPDGVCPVDATEYFQDGIPVPTRGNPLVSQDMNLWEQSAHVTGQVSVEMQVLHETAEMIYLVIAVSLAVPLHGSPVAGQRLLRHCPACTLSRGPDELIESLQPVFRYLDGSWGEATFLLVGQISADQSEIVHGPFIHCLGSSLLWDAAANCELTQTFHCVDSNPGTIWEVVYSHAVGVGAALLEKRLCEFLREYSHVSADSEFLQPRVCLFMGVYDSL